MSALEEQIDVDVPARVVWDFLHRVDAYPRFVDGVREARSEGRNRAHLDIEAGGGVRGIDAEYADRGQGRLMMWHTVKGADLSGTFSVLPIDDQHTRLQVRLEYDPSDVKDTFGGPKGFAQSSAIQRMVWDDLRHLKELVET